MRKNIGKALLVGALGCLALCACSTTYAATGTSGEKNSAGSTMMQTAPQEPRTVTVSAQGTAKAVPDKAEITFGVTTQSKSPDGAQKENAEKIDKVITYLKERGIEEKSICTSSYSLYPEYDYSNIMQGCSLSNGDRVQIQGSPVLGDDGRTYVKVYSPKSGKTGYVNAQFLS